MINILIIDNNQSDLITLKTLLEKDSADLIITIAKSGKEGLELCKSKPDIIIVDIITTPINSLYICEYTKTNENLKHVPVLIGTSSLPNKESKTKALAIGADGFLAKPIDELELKAQIKAILKIVELEKRILYKKEKLEKIVKEQSEVLRKTEEKFSKAFKSSPVAITITRLSDGCFIEINDTVEKLLGYSRDKFIGHTSVELDLYVNPNDRKHIVKTLIRKGSVQNFETQFYTKSGNIITTRQSLELININEEKCVISVYEDITEPKKTKKALENKEKLFKALIENSADAIILIDLKGTILYESPVYGKIMGRDVRLRIGKNVFEFIHPDDKYIATKALTDLILCPNETSKITLRNQHYNGSWRWLDCTATNLLEESAIRGLVINAHDITNRKLAEQALEEIKDSYIELFNSVTEAIYIINKEGIFIDVNDGAVKMYGFSREELIGKTPAFVSAPNKNNMPQIIELINKVALTGKAEQFEFWGIRKNGEIFPKEVVCNKSNYMGQTVIIAAARDITERKQAEDALKESEETYRNTIELAVDGIILGDKNGNLINVNSYACELTGFSKDELLNKNINDLISEDILIEKPLRYDLLKNGETITSERIIINKNGKRVPVEMRSKYMVHNDTYQTFIRDITERKKAEDALKESEEKYRLMVDHSPDGVIVHSSGKLVFANKAALKIMAAENLQQLQSKPAIEYVHPNYKEKAIQRINKIIQTKETSDFIEEKFIKLNNEVIDVEVIGIPIQFMGQFAIQTIIRDISIRNKIENALIESENKFRTLAESSPFAIMIYQGDYWVYTNPAGVEISGFSAEELYKKKYWEFVEEEFQNDIKEYGKDRQSGNITKNSYEFKIKSKDGKQKWVYLTGTIIYYMGKPAGIISVVDITERKRAEQIQSVVFAISNAVITSKNIEELIEITRIQLGTLLNTTNFYIAFYDKNTDMLTSLYASDEKDTITTWPAKKSLTGQVIKHNKPLLVTKEEAIKLYETGEIDLFGSICESWLGVPLHIDGKITGAFVVQSYKDPQAYNSKDVEMLEFISSQISISIQRKKSIEDLKTALEKAEESDQLKTAFLANMSHEIRTPMNAIIGFSALLNDGDLAAEERTQFVTIIKNNGQHLLSIINDIIDVAKIDSKQLTISNINFNLNNLLNELFISYENEKIIKEKDYIEFVLEKALPDNNSSIICDDVRLRQILYNLLSNALKFTFVGTIKFGYEIEKDKLLFFVKDTGKGIAIDKQSIIFERFSQEEITHTRQFGGTGLGLTISKGLVELLGGKIWVLSEKDKGSSFYFEIPYNPVKNETTKQGSNPQPSTKYDFTGKTVLIAEDEETNFILLKLILSRLGINLLYAYNGQQAIDIVKQNNTIDLILMDIKMPIINGFVATKEIKKIKPTIPIIAQTAYALSNDKEEALACGCDDYIAKPIDKQELINKIALYLTTK